MVLPAVREGWSSVLPTVEGIAQQAGTTVAYRVLAYAISGTDIPYGVRHVRYWHAVWCALCAVLRERMVCIV